MSQICSDKRYFLQRMLWTEQTGPASKDVEGTKFKLRGVIQEACKQSAAALPARVVNEACEKKSDRMACIFDSYH